MDNIQWLFLLVNHEKKMPDKYTHEEFCLDRYRAFLEKLGNPHCCGIPAVQILGTDGKGSTLAFLEALLVASGKHVCSFISPHLVALEERFRLDSRSIDAKSLGAYLERVKALPGSHELTFFEALNLAFWLWAKETAPDFILLETGLGGRLDTTTVSHPCLKILTLLDRDHARILGGTVQKIALEKLSALRKGIPAIISPQSDCLKPFMIDWLDSHGIESLWSEDFFESDILERKKYGWSIRVRQKGFRTGPSGTDLAFQSASAGRDWRLRLIGDHQVANFHSALLAYEILTGSSAARLPVWDLQTLWNGRCQFVEDACGCEWLLDGSHTPLSAQALREVLDATLPENMPRHFHLACTQDRFPWCYLRGLVRPQLDSISLVDTSIPRLWDAHELRDRLIECGWNSQPLPSLEIISSADVFTRAPEPDEPRILCGSLHWVGEGLRRIAPVGESNRHP